MTKRRPRVQIFKGRNGRWFFRQVAANGDKGARSAGSYSRRDSALRGVRRAFGPTVKVEKGR